MRSVNCSVSFLITHYMYVSDYTIVNRIFLSDLNVWGIISSLCLSYNTLFLIVI